MTAILTGVRVLDFGRYVAGPYCATLLGYLGADIIRVERREGGEDRYIAPVTADGEGAVFFQTACNKRSLTLDLGNPESGEIVHRLIERADVVVANLPPSALAKAGLDYASLTRIRPNIVLTTQSAFGDVGPYKDRGGFDGIGQAMSGAMHITGVPGAPAKAAAPYVDYATAVLAAFGTLAALMHRERTGEGQEVKGTLLGTALAVFNSHLIEQAVVAPNRSGSGNRVQTSAPSDVFATSDGHILLHVVGSGLFRRWARLMGEDDRWTSDPLYATDQSRADHSEKILERMRNWCAERTTAQALAELDKAGLPSGPVYSPQQALDDPQVAAMRIFSAVDNYPGLPKAAPVVGLPVQLTKTPGAIRRGPPRLGEHTDEILGELGFAPAEIAGLRARQVV